MNNYNSQHEQSHKNSHLFLSLYHEYILSKGAELTGWQKIPPDTHDQLTGIDTVLEINYERKITIDEKVRDVEYGDILLESYHTYDNTGSQSYGWAFENSSDLIAYLTPQNFYILRTKRLQKAIRNNWSKWKATLQSAKATTVNGAVIPRTTYNVYVSAAELNYLGVLEYKSKRTT